MRVAILTRTRARADGWLALLSAASSLEPTRVEADARLSAFRVLLVEGWAPEDLSLDGPPVVWIGPPSAVSNLLGGRIHAVLPPDVTPDELAATLTAAALELTVLTPAQTRTLFRPRPATRTESLPPEPLTARELEVLRLMADGLANKELAARLAISGNTAKFHVAQILAKLHAASRAEAVALGIRQGLVPL